MLKTIRNFLLRFILSLPGDPENRLPKKKLFVFFYRIYWYKY